MTSSSRPTSSCPGSLLISSQPTATAGWNLDTRVTGTTFVDGGFNTTVSTAGPDSVSISSTVGASTGMMGSVVDLYPGAHGPRPVSWNTAAGYVGKSLPSDITLATVSGDTLVLGAFGLQSPPPSWTVTSDSEGLTWNVISTLCGVDASVTGYCAWTATATATMTDTIALTPSVSVNGQGFFATDVGVAALEAGSQVATDPAGASSSLTTTASPSLAANSLVIVPAWVYSSAFVGTWTSTNGTALSANTNGNNITLFSDENVAGGAVTETVSESSGNLRMAMMAIPFGSGLPPPVCSPTATVKSSAISPAVWGTPNSTAFTLSGVSSGDTLLVWTFGGSSIRINVHDSVNDLFVDQTDTTTVAADWNLWTTTTSGTGTLTLTITPNSGVYSYMNAMAWDVATAVPTQLNISSVTESGVGSGVTTVSPTTSTSACSLAVTQWLGQAHTPDSTAPAAAAPAGWTSGAFAQNPFSVGEPNGTVFYGQTIGGNWTDVVAAGTIMPTFTSTGSATGAGTNYYLDAQLVTFGIAPPPAPTGLTAIAVSSTEIDLSWTNPSTGGLTDNHVYQSVGAGCTSPTPIDLSGVTESYMATGLAPDTQFSFYVTASNATGESPPSNCASATTFNYATAPTGLVLTTVSSTEIDLSWTNPVGESLVGSTVYEYAGASNCLGSVTASYAFGVAITAFDDTNLTVGTFDSFAVTASNSTGESPESNCAVGATFNVPGAPTSLVATPNGPNEILLTWVNPVGPLTDSHVYQAVGSGCSSPTPIDLGSVQTSFAASGLASNTLFSFYVTASNSTGESLGSNCESASTRVNTPPSVTISDVQSYFTSTFKESWSNGTWVNVTYALLVIANDSANCEGSVNINADSWTWLVDEGGALFIPETGTVNYEWNYSTSLNQSFYLGQTIWVGLFYQAGSFSNVTTCQQVTFNFTPPPLVISYDPIPIIIAGGALSIGIYVVVKFKYLRRKRWV